MATVGYSGKSLAAKLGLEAGSRTLVVGAPEGYAAWLGKAPGDATITHKAKLPVARGVFDLVHLFCRDRVRLEMDGPGALPLIADGGALWVSWPKKSSKLHRDLTEDGVREVMLPTGWVDVKVAAVNEDWSALKLLRRRAK
jgi:hypothetical protein